MSAQATAIALEVKAVAGRVRAAWPVEHFLPLAEEYLRLAKEAKTGEREKTPILHPSDHWGPIIAGYFRD